MTDSNKPKENTGNATTTHNPNKPGEVDKVNPTTGGSAGKIDTNDTSKD
jgi:hypothetical protein